MITLYLAVHNETGMKYFGRSSRFHTESINRMSKVKVGKKASNETKQKMSDAKKNIKKSDSHRENIRLARLGTKRDSAVCKNISESKKNARWMHKGNKTRVIQSIDVGRYLINKWVLLGRPSLKRNNT